MNTHYRFDQLPGFSRLHADLAENPVRAARWIPVAGRNQERLLAQAADAGGGHRAIHASVREMLLKQNPGAGNSVAGQRYLNRIREGHFLVVGGLSGGARFGGHLAILYQALTAAKVAQHLEALNIPVVPLIWVDGNLGTHSSCVLDLQNVARMIPGEPAADPGGSVGADGFQQLAEARDWLKRQLPSTDFGQRVLAGLDEACQHENPGVALTCFLSAALKEYGVLTLAVPQGGLGPAAEGIDGGLLRLAVERRSHMVAIRDELFSEGLGDQALALVLDAVLADPQRIASQALAFAALPWLARICAPMEVEIHACIRPLLQAGAYLDPVVLPAASMTIVEPKVGKVLEKYGLELTDFFLGEQHAHGRCRARLEGLQLNRQFEAAESRIAELLAVLARILERGDPGVKKVVDGIREKVLYQLTNLKNKQEQSWHRQQDIARQQVDKALHYLLPLGQRQEGLVNVNYFLVRYGQAFIQAVYQQAEAFACGHRLFPYVP